MPQEMYDEDEVAEARDEGYEEGLAEGLKKLQPKGGEDGQCHFIIRVEDLADAIYDGRVPSRSAQGQGTRTDARYQAEQMLVACGFKI